MRKHCGVMMGGTRWGRGGGGGEGRTSGAVGCWGQALCVGLQALCSSLTECRSRRFASPTPIAPPTSPHPYPPHLAPPRDPSPEERKMALLDAFMAFMQSEEAQVILSKTGRGQ